MKLRRIESLVKIRVYREVKVFVSAEEFFDWIQASSLVSSGDFLRVEVVDDS